MADAIVYPDDYVPRFTQEQILERFIFICEACDNYLGSVAKLHPHWKLANDPMVLLNVAQSALGSGLN